VALDPFTIGWKIWTTVRPWRRLKEARNRSRARKGKSPLPITEEDDLMLPKGTQTYTGLAILILTPLVAKYGIGSEDLSLWVTAIGTVIGGILGILGRIRAGKAA